MTSDNSQERIVPHRSASKHGLPANAAVSASDVRTAFSGMDGWNSFTPDDGSFERVRYTGMAFQVPVGFHVYENGILIRFAEQVGGNTRNHFTQA